MVSETHTRPGPLSDLLSGLVDAALGVCSDGRIACANESACSLLQCRGGDIVGRNVSELDSDSASEFWPRFFERPSWDTWHQRQFFSSTGEVVPVALKFHPGESLNLCIVRPAFPHEIPTSVDRVLFRDLRLPQLLVDVYRQRIVDANETAENFYGQSRHVLREAGLDGVIELGPEKLAAELRRAASAEIARIELPHRIHDGQIRHCPVFVLRARQAGDSLLLQLVIEDAAGIVQLNQELISYRELIDNLPVGVFRTTADQRGRILMANQALCNILDVASPAELIGEEPASFYADADGRRAFVEPVSNTDGTSVTIHRMLTRKGRQIWVRMTARRRTDELGRAFFEGAMEDVTEWRRAEANVNKAERIIENANEGISVTDAEGNIVAVNPSFTRITGYSGSEVIGKNPRILSSGRHSAGFYARMWEEIERKGHWQGEIFNRRKSGEVYPQWLTISAIRDETGAAQNYAAVFTDLTSIRRSREKLDRLERMDPLTGLFNRSEFVVRLDEEVGRAAKNGLEFCLVVVGIDDFTRLNNIHSTEVGDEVLITLAQRFLMFRGAGAILIGRINSDEFALLFEQPGDLTAVDARITEVLERGKAPIQCRSTLLPEIRMTAGASLYPADGQTAERLLGHSEATLNHSKKLNRGGYRLFHREIEVAEERRLWLRDELAKAIGEQALELAYQPIVEAHTGRVAGAEALARWSHPTEGSIAPDEFIAIAEESKLIDRLTFQLLEKACRFFSRIRASYGLDLRLGFNFSTLQLTDRNLATRVLETLSAGGLPASCFKLELTESRLMTDVEGSLACIQSLRNSGLNISVDDFGTGFSSLAYLQQIRPQALKIDRRFICELPGNQEDAAISSTIIAMAHRLGQQVIAEGVETQAQLDFLVGEGCEFYQGYLCSPPLPPDQFEALLRAGGSESGG